MRFFLKVGVIWILAASAADAQVHPLEPLYRAAKPVEDVLASGMTVSEFRKHLQALSVEVSIGKDRAATEPEKQTVAEYEIAFQKLRDALALIQFRNDSSEIVNGYLETFKKGDIILTTSPDPVPPSLLAIVERNKLQTTTATMGNRTTSLVFTILPATSVNAVLKSASESLAQASQRFISLSK